MAKKKKKRKGAGGRPQRFGERGVSTTIWIPPSLKAQLQEEAEAEGRTLSHHIGTILVEHRKGRKKAA